MTAHDDRQEQLKKVAAERSLELIEDGMLFGLGTGSTIAHLIPMLGARVAEGLRVRAVPTSVRSRDAAIRHGIEVVDVYDGAEPIALTIDGADEVDPQLRLVKGGGGALLREKIVASCSERVAIVADSKKIVEHLGAFPVPVEVIKLGWRNVSRRLDALGGAPTLRQTADGPYVTDEDNYILDCHFGSIADPDAVSASIDAIVGVVEHGLFIGIADLVIVGEEGGARVIRAAAR
jgi:ribose 5-phosphate isomerase A